MRVVERAWFAVVVGAALLLSSRVTGAVLWRAFRMDRTAALWAAGACAAALFAAFFVTRRRLAAQVPAEPGLGPLRFLLWLIHGESLSLGAALYRLGPLRRNVAILPSVLCAVFVAAAPLALSGVALESDRTTFVGLAALAVLTGLVASFGVLWLDYRRSAWRTAVLALVAVALHVGTAAALLWPDALAQSLARQASRRETAGDAGDPLPLLDRAVLLNPRSPGIRHRRALVLMERGRLGGAVADLTAAIAADPFDARALDNRGHAKLGLGDEAGALADFDAAIRVDPTHANGWYNRGVVRKARGEADAAIADFTEALRLDPGKAEAFFHRGAAHELQRRAERAMADYERALQTARPDWPHRQAAEESLRSLRAKASH